MSPKRRDPQDASQPPAEAPQPAGEDSEQTTDQPQPGAAAASADARCTIKADKPIKEVRVLWLKDVDKFMQRRAK